MFFTRGHRIFRCRYRTAADIIVCSSSRLRNGSRFRRVVARIMKKCDDLHHIISAQMRKERAPTTSVNAMQPTYLTLSSSGSSPWQLTNWHGSPPMQIGFAVTVASLSSTWQIDVTLADPSGTFPSTAVTVFGASEVGGPAASSINGVGSISTCPIAAWRLTNNSTGGSVHVAALQTGIG